MLCLHSGKAYISGKLVAANILIDGGVIKKISSSKLPAEKEIDCSGKIILPGAIDVHVHLRCPGLEYKEDIVSGSLAALHGGVTTVMDMPNTKPPTVTVKDFAAKKALAQKGCAVNFDAYMGATGLNLHEIENVQGLRGVKVYFGQSTGNMLLNGEKALEELFILAQRKGFVVAVHAEDEEEIRKNERKYAGENSPEVHAKIRSDVAEEKAIKKIIELQSRIGNKIHIAHLSSKKGLNAVLKAKRGKHGNLVSCEVTPNHLFLDALAYKKFGNLVKCNPSIKYSADRKALWGAFKKGSIEICATDHAPHTLEEKRQGYWEAPSGIPGLETMLPLLLNEVAKGKIGLKRVVEAVAEKPSLIFGWGGKGFIKEGYDADLVVVDMKKKWRVEEGKLFTKAMYSPFAGQKLKGFVEKTIVGGEVFG